MALDTENYIMAIGRNRSGMYSGELDYSIYSSRFDDLSLVDKIEVARLLSELSKKCYADLHQAGQKTPLWYRIYRWVDVGYFKHLGRQHVYWPISLSWGSWRASPPYITGHGWQIGQKNTQRIYGWTLHLGKLKVIFGKGRKVNNDK